jgi:protein-S-isoprenylcysteine O-methyltransferase Ste14
MPDWIFEAVYLAGIVVEMAIRAPLNRRRRQMKVVTSRLDGREALLLGLLFLGMFLLPLVYIFTPWLDFANYTLPAWARWAGVVLLIGAVGVFWQAHRDLGRNWSPTLELHEGHSLISHGIYAYIRHPMYASQWLWIIAQGMLLPNWIAGVGGALLFLPMYLVRVPIEEQMMLDQFGPQYRDYMARTGRVVPRLSGEKQSA